MERRASLGRASHVLQKYLPDGLYNMSVSVGVAIITHNARHHLQKCLPPYLNSRSTSRIVVVNSSSNDGTIELAQEMGAETLVLPRLKFNHGSTREKARKYLKTDIVVMATPDAYLLDGESLEHLIKPIVTNQAALAYGKQIAHDGADFFESFAREFNYPSQSHIRSLKDIEKYGSYTYFCSNSFSAYSNKALEAVGGFSSVLIGEDTVAAAKLLNAGHSIAYIAEAIAKHSHRYNLKEEFLRSFDTGLARKAYQELIMKGGKDTVRGRMYVRALLARLAREKPHLIPYAIFQSGIKWLGYKLGQASLNAPRFWKKTLSAQDFYWASEDSRC
ncbi:O antigen biosynthesis rhamnosyltransferase RfbN [Chlamydiales bacterium STE3]|nr:O antigen biosynthesis rhamnosyltransferase RfbN [Chlamydiales bacterium STE3]